MQNIQFVSPKRSHLESLAKSSKPVRLDIHDHLSAVDGYVASYISIATASGWRPCDIEIRDGERHFIAEASSGDLVRRIIIWRLPTGRLFRELHYAVIDDTGVCLAVTKTTANWYIQLRMPDLQGKIDISAENPVYSLSEPFCSQGGYQHSTPSHKIDYRAS